jgi:ABC-type arginine transport system permease subunit
MLTRYRRSGSKSYAALEIAIDALLTLLLLGIYVAGIIILASRGVSNWSDIYDYKIARGIPQVYANLSCILIW